MTYFLNHPEILIRKPIRSSKNLWIHPKVRSGGILGNFVHVKLYQEMIRRLQLLIQNEIYHWSWEKCWSSAGEVPQHQQGNPTPTGNANRVFVEVWQFLLLAWLDDSFPGKSASGRGRKFMDFPRVCWVPTSVQGPPKQFSCYNFFNILDEQTLLVTFSHGQFNTLDKVNMRKKLCRRWKFLDIFKIST